MDLLDWLIVAVVLGLALIGLRLLLHGIVCGLFGQACSQCKGSWGRHF